jgi:hypothetical protein
VCVPINPEHVWDFDPDHVTTVHDLLDTDEDGATAAAASAAMEEAVHVFRSCFLDDVKAASRQALISKARTAASEGLAW